MAWGDGVGDGAPGSGGVLTSATWAIGELVVGRCGCGPADRADGLCVAAVRMAADGMGRPKGLVGRWVVPCMLPLLNVVAGSVRPHVLAGRAPDPTG